jgi:cytochrome c oxidase cbb3-type subunit 3
MSDFTSGFWNLYVIVLTVASLAGCAWLLIVMSKARGAAAPPKGTKDTTGHVWDGDLAEYNNPLPKWWLNLFWITIVFSVVYLVLYPGFGSFPGVLGWSSRGAYTAERQRVDKTVEPLFARYRSMDVREVAADPEARAMGERLFLNYCSQCHGSSALGGRGFPNLTDKDWLYGGEPEAIAATIANGRLGVMPALGAALGPDGVKNVVAYVRSLSGLPHDRLSAQLGKPQFVQTCAACHGADGKGNTAIGAPNLTDDVWLFGSSDAAIAEGVMRGRNLGASEGTLAMPAFKDVLGEGKIHLLAAYVWGLSNRPAAGNPVSRPATSPATSPVSNSVSNSVSK